MNKFDVDGDGIVDISNSAKSLEGLSATITELNYLKGLSSNVQSQIDALVNGMTFKGEYNTYADMKASITDPQRGNLIYILVDEKVNQTNTQYIYDGEEWVFGGGRTIVNDASTTSKGIIQLSGDLTGTANYPELKEISAAKTAGYISSISIDEKGRVTSVTEDATLLQRIINLENRPRIYVQSTQPENMVDGDIWIRKG